MAYRQLRAKEVTTTTEPVESQLAPEQVAAYFRQSSTGQVLNNLESADMQLSGAQRFAVSQGLDADKIVIAHEGNGKRGVSGTLRIEQREELRELVAGIQAGSIKLVWAATVSRLFRDPTGVQTSTFIDICAKHGVKVVIENAKTFDFSNQFDILMFQILANVAAQENADRSRLLHAARARRSLRGFYDGRPLVAGFVVDRKELQADGKPNPNYMKFIPYEPHSRVVLWLYEEYRRLGGRFNLLWREVVKLPVLFPSFKPGIDARDVRKFPFKKVPGGYHINRQGLSHLLGQVDHAGYWKYEGQVLTDENGHPLRNHEAIVPENLWRYAFENMSYTTMTGEKNVKRVDKRAGWSTATAKGQDRETKGMLLQGVLSSPIGRVWASSGRYLVVARQNENADRTNTLTITADMLDDIFMCRLVERTSEADRTALLEHALRDTRQSNKRAMTSVDEQIAGYKKEIANVQAGIKAYIEATGGNADKETLQKFNEQIVDARANLNALETSKNEALAKESSILELINTMKCICGTEWQLDDNQTRRYIKLAVKSAIIEEYSSHYLKLTVTWREPFGQTDVCYIHRADGGHQEWTTEDTAELARMYPHADRLEILRRWPIRTWGSLKKIASTMGLKRYTTLNTSGVHGQAACLADMELMKSYGWDTVEPVRWVYDVPMTSSDLGVSLT